MKTRAAYLKTRRRKLAEAKRCAGAADRAAERLDLERKWHRKRDSVWREGGYVPKDGLKSHVEEEFVTSEVAVGSDGKEVEVARSSVRDDAADEVEDRSMTRAERNDFRADSRWRDPTQAEFYDRRGPRRNWGAPKMAWAPQAKAGKRRRQRGNRGANTPCKWSALVRRATPATSVRAAAM